MVSFRTLLIKPPSPFPSSLLSPSQKPHRKDSINHLSTSDINQLSPMASSSSSSSRRPSFSMADDGLASIAEFSGAGNPYTHRHLFISRKGSLRSFSSSSPRSIPGRIFDTRFNEATFNPPHFLDSCALCKKPLSGNRDIFMYRGDMPFCTEECRKEQIEMDEAMEKSRSIKAIRNKQKDSSSSAAAQQNAASSPGKSRKYLFRAGIAAA